MIKGVDYIGVGVECIITDGKGKYLLAKRGSKAKNERGKWEFPGGGIEYGDTMADTIKREMKEELGIEVELLEYLPPNDHQHWVTSAFIARIVDGEPKIMEPEKCEEIGWFTLDEIETIPLSIATKLNVE
jgi:mutator protein MutT